MNKGVLCPVGKFVFKERNRISSNEFKVNNNDSRMTSFASF